MKRILISLLLSILLVVLLASIPFLLTQYKIIDVETSYILAMPVRFPVLIYVNLLGFDVPKNDLMRDLITISLMFSVIVFYTLLFYVLLTLIKRFKKKETEKIDNPPEPPVFANSNG